MSQGVVVWNLPKECHGRIFIWPPKEHQQKSLSVANPIKKEQFENSTDLPDCHDMAVEGCDDDVLDVIAVHVDQGGRCQHSLHLVCVDGHSLKKCHNNDWSSLKQTLMSWENSKNRHTRNSPLLSFVCTDQLAGSRRANQIWRENNKFLK